MHTIKFLLITTLLLPVIYSFRIGITQRKTCPSVKLKNGRVRYRSKNGGFAQFQCNRGYLLAGEKYMKCVNGNWEGDIPLCLRNTCSKAKLPDNGFVYQSHRGAMMIYFCKAGYEIKGNNVVTCDGQKWSGPLPPCIASDKNVSLNCDFEREDLCGWSHDLNHDFDWTRMQLSTPSGHVHTGPSKDHTTGKGYYMYIEASSRNVNDTARLISPVYEKQVNNTCLEFYYHMYGLATGELRVYLKKISESWDLNVDNAIFRKFGNQGNRWKRLLVNLGSIDEDFQVVMEGVRGHSYTSDIAIDDVRIIENCNEVEEDEDEITTTTFSYTEELYYPDYTCKDRCEVYDDSYFCSCSIGCTLNNSCCPDYIAYCILGDDIFTEDYQTTEEILIETTDIGTSTDLKNYHKAIRSTAEIFTTTTSKPIQELITKITIIPTPKSTTKPNIKSTPKPAIISTTKLIPLLKTTVARTIFVPTINSTKPLNKYKNSLIEVTLPPMTTNKFSGFEVTKNPMTKIKFSGIEVTLKPIKPPSVLKPTTKIATLTPKIIIKPRMDIQKPAQNEVLKNDIAVVPVIKNNDKELLVNPPNLKETRLGSQKIVKTTTAGPPTTVLIIAFVCTVIGTIIVGIIIKRRYMCVRFKNIRSRSCGDSQSDVRFLTSDEVLDFTLATND